MAVPPARPIDSASSDDRTRESSVRRVRVKTLAPLPVPREIGLLLVVVVVDYEDGHAYEDEARQKCELGCNAPVPRHLCLRRGIFPSAHGHRTPATQDRPQTRL